MSLYDDPAGLDVSYNDDDGMLAVPGQHNHKGPDNGSASTGANGNGLGSLADELAGALGNSDDEAEEGDEEESYYGDEGSMMTSDESALNGRAVNGSQTSTAASTPRISHKHMNSHHQRPPSASDYDGSDYGDPDDLVESGISFGLEDKLSQIERLAMRNKMMMKEDVEGYEDGEGVAGAVPRLMDGLQKLMSQSTLETGSTRLITAHTALSSHMMHQTRTLRDLSFAINAASLPPPETADLLLSLIDLIPRPTLQPLAELSTLHNLTLSLISQLSFLSDSLHMARQSSIAANRKLRVAKEACADWKSELEAVEKARRWIEEGDWDGRCRRREAAVVCAEVTGGFEDVCRGFEEKLKAQSVAA